MSSVSNDGVNRFVPSKTSGVPSVIGILTPTPSDLAISFAYSFFCVVSLFGWFFRNPMLDRSFPPSAVSHTWIVFTVLG